MDNYEHIVRVVLEHYPCTQAIYLFGTYGAEDESADSDVDIALLLPHHDARQAGSLAMSAVRLALARLLAKDVDLINLRLAPTVLQKEVLIAERRILCADAYATDEFEMLAFSYYQKLNEERAEVLAEGLRSGRFFNV